MRMKLVICLLCLTLLSVACRSSKAEIETTANVDTESSQVTTDASASMNALDVVTATPGAPTAVAASEAAPQATAAEQTTAENDQNVGADKGAADGASAADVAVSAPVLAANSDSAAVQESATVASAPEGVMPQRISIPSINLDTGVVELAWHPVQDDDGRIFSEWDVADQAAGWHKNSSLIEQGGNVVLSGHNNILGAVFRELDQLKRGDEAVLWSGNEEHRYLVDKVMIVPEKYATQEQREANAAWIGHFEDDRLTLVSCWPRDDNSHRIIVVAYADDSQASVSN